MKIINGICMLVFIISSCNDRYHTKYPYSLNDFRPALRQQLERALSQELYGWDTTESWLEHNASAAELKKLALCEHPLLRFKALRTIGYRKEMDRFDIIMNHLDDTAWVIIDAGEFGTWPRRVSDHMLFFVRWDSQALKDKTVDKVLLQHNYLEEAYRILRNFKPTEKYYASIREMAGRYRPDFAGETSLALYALASFGKKEDVSLVRHMLDTNIYRLDRSSFELMQQWPDTVYLPILVRYASGGYLTSNIRSDGINAPTTEYFECIASYKNKEAAAAYDIILKKLQWLYCAGDTASLKLSLRRAYWENKCEAYQSILPRIKPFIEEEERQDALRRKKYGDMEPIEIYDNLLPDITSKEVGWP